MTGSLLNTAALQAAWELRKAALKREKYGRYIPVLYTSVFDLLSEAMPEVQDQLDHICRTASSVSDLTLPIWTYTTRHFINSEADEYEDFNYVHPTWDYTVWQNRTAERIRDEGYHQQVHVPGSPSLSVKQIISETDFVQSLCVGVFGTKHYWLSDSLRSTHTVDDLGIEVETRQLVLQFYPDGLPEEMQVTLENAQRITQLPPSIPRIQRHRSVSSETLTPRALESDMEDEWTRRLDKETSW
jgi:hypothetical protein